MAERELDEHLHPVQLEIFRAMSPEQRLRIAEELTRATWNRALEAVARAHPELNQAQVLKKFVAMNYGQHLAEAVYPQV
jgi:hypothetical protein